MSIEPAVSSAMRAAILDYFNGERFEMLIAVAVLLVVVSSALWHFYLFAL